MPRQFYNIHFGVVERSQYERLIKSAVFKKLEKFSNLFLARNQNQLKGYQKKWVKDPLHQWSRQWEYPFVAKEIYRFIRGRDIHKLKILDAGSGVTFFPFFVQNTLKRAQVTCLDLDAEFKFIFKKINKIEKSRIDFKVGDLHFLPFKDSSLDVIYCVSVLEHLTNRKKAMEEFYRVLKTNGILILTFDISLSPISSGILIRSSQQIFNELNTVFGASGQLLTREMGSGRKYDFVSTQHFLGDRINLLPWNQRILNNIQKIFGSWIFLLIPNLVVGYAVLLKEKR